VVALPLPPRGHPAAGPPWPPHCHRGGPWLSGQDPLRPGPTRRMPNPLALESLPLGCGQKRRRRDQRALGLHTL